MYDDDRLKQLRRNFLRDNRADEFNRLAAAGELDGHLQERADACRVKANWFVESGTTFEGQAWQWAIRTILLESPMD